MGKELFIPQEAYHAGKTGKDLNEEESARYISMCLDRLEGIQTNFALRQIYAHMEMVYDDFTSRREKGNRIKNCEVNTGNEIDFYYHPESNKNFARVGRGADWNIVTFGNVVLREKESEGEPFIKVTDKVVKEIAPGIHIHQAEIHAPARRTGNIVKIWKEEPGIYRKDIDGGQYLGWFGKSPGICMVFLDIEAISDGIRCETGFRLRAKMMGCSDEWEHTSMEDIRDYRQLMREYEKSMGVTGGLREWINGKLEHTFWTGPDLDFKFSPEQRGNALII